MSAKTDKTPEKKKTCFIAMPITTPPDHLERYGGDAEHFIHVLDALFKPAVRAAGFEPISPLSIGSEIIHADIITNLVKADLVLVDMTTLNANVFFEFGIRSSLNKPTCLIRDMCKMKVPFDTSTANHHIYDPDLRVWVVEQEIPKLAKHIADTFERSDGKNALWKHFGVQAIGAEPSPPAEGDKLNYLIQSVAAMNQKVSTIVDRETRASRGTGAADRWMAATWNNFTKLLSTELARFTCTVGWQFAKGSIELHIRPVEGDEVLAEIQRIVESELHARGKSALVYYWDTEDRLLAEILVNSR